MKTSEYPTFYLLPSIFFNLVLLGYNRSSKNITIKIHHSYNVFIMAIHHRLPLFLLIAGLFAWNAPLLHTQEPDADTIPKTVYIAKLAKPISGEQIASAKQFLLLTDPIKTASMFNISAYIPYESSSIFYFGGGIMSGSGGIDGVRGFGFQVGMRAHFSEGLQSWFVEWGIHSFDGEDEEGHTLTATIVNGSVGYMLPLGNVFVLELSGGIDIQADDHGTEIPLFYTYDGEGDGKIFPSLGIGFGLRL